MTKKHRRERSKQGYRSPQEPRAAAPAVREPRGRSEVPGFLGWLSRGTGDSGFPSIPRSVGRGFVTAGSNLPILATPFLFLFAAWLGLVALGLEGPPGRLANLAALPPVGTYFDALNGVTIYGYGLGGLVAAAAFLVVRAAFVAVMTGMVVAALEGAPVGAGVFRGLRAFPIVFAVNVLSMSMMMSGTIILPFLGPGLGFLGSVLILVATLFFFAFAPAAAVRERRGLSDTLRRSARAALLPGSRHVLMSLLYIFLCLPLLVAFTPSGSVLTVNPSLATWVYALLATFVHVGFLAGFAYRWMAVERSVPDQPVKLRRR